MRTKEYKIVRVIENNGEYFNLVREFDNAILSSKRDIADVIEDFKRIEYIYNSDVRIVLSDCVRTEDYTTRTISYYK